MNASDVQHIAITFADDTVGVMTFVTAEYDTDGEPRWRRLATADNVNAEIDRSSFQAGKLPIREWHFVEPADIPEDRSFRDAWRHGKNGFTVDMHHARRIHRDRIRVAREPILAALDVEYQRADERGDTAAKTLIAGRKQLLRDATSDRAIEKAATPDALHAVWPAVLADSTM